MPGGGGGGHRACHYGPQMVIQKKGVGGNLFFADFRKISTKIHKFSANGNPKGQLSPELGRFS